MRDFYSFAMLGKYGRLGNQMFQVATVASLARLKGCDLVLPNNENTIIRKCFNIPCIDATEDHSFLTKGRWQEPSFCYSRQILDLPTNVDILGYLQSWRYLFDEKYIRQIFSFDKSVIERCKNNLPIGELISLHVRRGDYLKFPKVFPLPSVEYYEDAVSSIKSERQDAIPVIFTDDKKWCEENFPKMQIFSTSEIDDLCMMSLCKHHVIANSSFSWWGSWLAKSEEQIVYSPHAWFGPEGPQDTQDLLPPWYRRS